MLICKGINDWRFHEASEVLVAQSRLTLCDLVNYSLPDSSVHGIL